MKIGTTKRACLLHCCNEFQLNISSCLWIIVVWKLESWAHIQTRTHTRTQLKIIFLDVLDYSEYSDTNISYFFHKNVASSVRKQNTQFSLLPHWRLFDQRAFKRHHENGLLLVKLYYPIYFTQETSVTVIHFLIFSDETNQIKRF